MTDEVLCYSVAQVTCIGGAPELGIMSVEDCCLGEGYWYGAEGSDACNPCVGKSIFGC